jgi:hypothetical protein
VIAPRQHYGARRKKESMISWGDYVIIASRRAGSSEDCKFKVTICPLFLEIVTDWPHEEHEDRFSYAFHGTAK